MSMHTNAGESHFGHAREEQGLRQKYGESVVAVLDIVLAFESAIQWCMARQEAGGVGAAPDGRRRDDADEA